MGLINEQNLIYLYNMDTSSFEQVIVSEQSNTLDNPKIQLKFKIIILQIRLKRLTNS